MCDHFSELNFDPVKEILKIWCHIYILMKKVVSLRKIHVKMKSFTPLYKQTKHMPQLLIYYIQYENRKSWFEQMPKAATGVFFSQETPLPEETPVNFVKFLRTLLLQNNSGRLLPNYRHFNNEARGVDCICCRELDALLCCFG